MTETVEIEETLDKQDELFSRYIESKEVRDGSSLDALSVDVESRLFPEVSIGEFLPQSNQDLEVETPSDISEEDIKHTIWSAENGVFHNIEDSVELKGKFEGLENRVCWDKLLDGYKASELDDESVYVVRHDTGHIVRCDIGHVVEVSFRDSMGRQKSIEKKFRSKEDANEFAEMISEDTNQDAELSYDNGLELHTSSKSLKDSFKKCVEEDRQSLFIYATCYLYWLLTYLVISNGFAIFIISMITMIIASQFVSKTYMNYNSYDNVYDIEYKSGGTKVTIPEDIDMVKEISVETEIEDERVLIKSDNIDTHWEFDIKDGILSEDAIRFFDNIGKETILDNKTTMQASRIKSGKESIESIDGKWYLSRPH